MKSLQNTGIQKSESLSIIKFRLLLIHIVSLGIFIVPVNADILIWALATFFIRIFSVEAGYHRYFAHRSYKSSRVFRFLIAVLAASNGQRGPIWWAYHHRLHHSNSDKPEDPHSPIQRGYWHAHFGWILDKNNCDTNLDAVKDLSKLPELVWLNKYHYIFPYLLMTIIFIVGQYTTAFGENGVGVSAVIWIFFFSTLLSLHVTLTANSLTHGIKPNFLNYRRYNTDDTTTNAWALFIPTMGTCWHNNHHRFMNSARAGFYWWEIDLTYLILKFLSLFGVVWDLQPVPQHILDEGRKQLDNKQTLNSEQKD